MMLLFDAASRELGLGIIALRLACALIIGVVIGTERENAHRPAGIRTHMLVALGSCAVMLTSQLMFSQYHALGSNSDPARLSAQVIAGVGFLGAGTIIREGASVKGLTTAASIWTVACLGIAVGAGYYYIGLMGTGCMLLTLIVFDWVQKKCLGNRYGSCDYKIRCEDVSEVLNAINRAAEANQVKIKAMRSEALENGQYRIRFHGVRHGRRSNRKLQQFFTELAGHEAVLRISSEKCD